MIDARNIYRKVTRKIYDFTPEQAQNLSAIVWLYRGQSDRFISLVQSYLDRTLVEASSIAEKALSYRNAYDAFSSSVISFLQTQSKESTLHVLLNERDDAASNCFQELEKWTAKIANDWKTPCDMTLEAQKKRLEELNLLSDACRRIIKDIDLVYKLSTRLVETAEKDAGARTQDYWDSRAVNRLEKDLDKSRKEIVEQLKSTSYFQRQADWLLSRFPAACFAPVPGLCRIVTQSEIEAADWSLTPGRYVGVAPAEVDEDFNFEQALRDIHIELADLNQEASSLATKIQVNFARLGI